MKTKLFSNDGIDPSHARREPDTIYFPDENTQQEIRYLFTTLQSAQNEKDASGAALNIRNLPYSSDLADLASDTQGNLLSFDDVVNSMCRVATHFIASQQLIQSRANAYLRCKLASAEVTLQGSVTSQLEESVERDQILLSSVTVPSSPREPSGFQIGTNKDEIDRMNRGSSLRRIPSGRGDRSREAAVTPPPASLFKSNSVLQDHLQHYPASIISLDDLTLSAALNFLSNEFLPAGFLSRKSRSRNDADRLAEIWDFFDFDDDGIVTRDDLVLGIGNIAKCYLAMDDFTQLMANSYVQRKVRRAVNAIDLYQKNNAMSPAPSLQSLETIGNIATSETQIFPHNTTVIYSDEEGNNHVAKVIRVSQRKMANRDAYYIETKGVKLYVSVARLRLLNAQDRAMLERHDPHRYHNSQQQQAQPQSMQQQPSAPTTTSTQFQQASTPALQVQQEPAPLMSSSSTSSKDHVPVHPQPHVTPKSPHTGQNHHIVVPEDGLLPRSTQTRTVASPVAQPGGILGYLKSSLGIGGAKSAAVVPTSSESEIEMEKEPPQQQHSADLDSVFESVDDRVFHTDTVVVVNGVLSSAGQKPQRGRSIDTLDLLSPAEQQPQQGTTVTTESVVAVAIVDAHPLEVSANSLTSQDNSIVTASQRLKQSTAMLAMDGAILQLVGRATGPSFQLARSMVPKPKKIEPYPIYFNRGKNGFFEFNQVDFGVQFVPFMRDIIQPNDAKWQSHSESLSETNRCFFLHFGVAMGLHPFSLQQCFRNAAAELLKFPENEMTIFFGEALESLLLRNDFVDAQVLSAIWPLEFDRYKVLIVRVDHNGRIESFTSFRSEAGPVDEHGEWNGDELIFTLQWNHFTILKPKSDQLNRPITAVLAAASMIGIMPLEFVTKVDADVSKRFKIC